MQALLLAIAFVLGLQYSAAFVWWLFYIRRLYRES